MYTHICMYVCVYVYVYMFEKVWEDMTTSWPVSWTPVTWGSALPPATLERGFCLCSWLLAAAARIQPWGSDVVLLCLDRICDWAELRPLHKLFRFGGQVCRSTCPAPKTSFLNKFPCLLNLPPTNLEGPPSVFHLSLPSLHGPVSDYKWKATKELANQQYTVYVFDEHAQWCVGFDNHL